MEFEVTSSTTNSPTIQRTVPCVRNSGFPPGPTYELEHPASPWERRPGQVSSRCGLHGELWVARLFPSQPSTDGKAPQQDLLGAKQRISGHLASSQAQHRQWVKSAKSQILPKEEKSDSTIQYSDSGPYTVSVSRKRDPDTYGGSCSWAAHVSWHAQEAREQHEELCSAQLSLETGGQWADHTGSKCPAVQGKESGEGKSTGNLSWSHSDWKDLRL